MPEKPAINPVDLIELMSQVRRGTIRIPDFQRAYIWREDQVQELLESVWNGYPLGSILLWGTTEKLHELDPLGLGLPELPAGHERLYLLDGQQRLISLYSVLYGILRLGKEESKTRYYVFFNLDTEKFVLQSESEAEENQLELEDGYLSLDRLISFSGENFMTANLDAEVLDKLAGFSKRIQKYNSLHNAFCNLRFATITTRQSLKVACSIFERLNSRGTKLTVADLMVAITYEPDFRLRDKLSGFNDQLIPFNFELDNRSILQAISACLSKGTEKDDIIDSAKEMKTHWSKTTQSILLAIDFLKKNHCVPTSNLLPYEIVVAPLAYFFYLHGGKQLDDDRIKALKKYFWLNLFEERFTSSQPSKTKVDVENMVQLLANPKANLFNYYEAPTITKEAILETDVSPSASFALTVLCFLGSKRPLEFVNGQEVTLDQTLGEANRRQLHHIFPINYANKYLSREKDFKNKIKPRLNSVANVSLLSRATNRDIWDTEPSIYFANFKKEHSKHFEEALKSHLIFNVDDFGISTNDFPKFINKRAETISNEMNAFANSLKQS
jgi:hypothetical protein